MAAKKTKTRKQKLEEALKAAHEAISVLYGAVNCLPVCVEEFVGDAGAKKLQRAERLYEDL